MDNKRPIIVVKRKASHHGHHGGAWKVAYADFVTAMMALFIVLWLLNTSKQLQEAVGGYFKDPTGNSKKVGTDVAGSGDNFVVTKDNMEQLKQQLQKTIRKVSNFDKFKNQITMTVTSEGLRIELTETEKGTFFDRGSKVPNENGRDLLAALANELGTLPNHLSIEGHTDSVPYSGDGSSYSNWELSADRANATRKLLQLNGVRKDQVSQVRGFADQSLKIPSEPENPANRRISLIIQYLSANLHDEAGRTIPPRALIEKQGDAKEGPGAPIKPENKPKEEAGQQGSQH